MKVPSLVLLPIALLAAPSAFPVSSTLQLAASPSSLKAAETALLSVTSDSSEPQTVSCVWSLASDTEGSLMPDPQPQVPDAVCTATYVAPQTVSDPATATIRVVDKKSGDTAETSIALER